MRPLHRPAFTLIEMVVVILIIAALSSLVAPAYSRFWGRTKYDSTLKEVEDIFAYSREQAILHDTTTTLRYEAQSQTFRATITPSAPITDQPSAYQEGDNPTQSNAAMPTEQTARIAINYEITDFHRRSGKDKPESRSNETEVHFYGDGTTEGATFTLTDRNEEHAVHLTLWPGTGRLTRED